MENTAVDVEGHWVGDQQLREMAVRGVDHEVVLVDTFCAISPPSRTTHEFCETPRFVAILPDSWRSDHSLLPVAVSGALCHTVFSL